ncbi:hypothetical protein BGX38DRAFT_176265 [Terfezia claveryi]|nr:hypothetical protein BGX38DRAFT_176265 [Terfezia claveryi]
MTKLAYARNIYMQPCDPSASPNPHTGDGDTTSNNDTNIPCWRHGVNRSNKRWVIWQTIDRKLFHIYYTGCADIFLSEEWISSPANCALPPPPKFNILNLMQFRNKLAAIYTHSDPSKLHLFFPDTLEGCAQKRPSLNLFDVIYKTFLPGPKNLTLMRSRGLFPVGRINFRGHVDSEFRYHVPTEKFTIAEVTKWHREFVNQLKTRMATPLTPEEREQEDSSVVHIFESAVFKDSFEKVFIFVDRMESWREEGVLLIEVLPLETAQLWATHIVGNHEAAGAGSRGIELLIGVEGVEVTELLGGDGSGSEWRVWRLNIEKAVQVVMALQPGEDWIAGKENDLIVECGWNDREENGTGRPVENIH